MLGNIPRIDLLQLQFNPSRFSLRNELFRRRAVYFRDEWPFIFRRKFFDHGISIHKILCDLFSFYMTPHQNE